VLFLDPRHTKDLRAGKMHLISPESNLRIQPVTEEPEVKPILGECRDAHEPHQRALLPVPLDDLRGALRREVGVLARTAEGSPLTQEVPQTIQIDPDLLEPRDVILERRISMAFALAQFLALRFERLDLGFNLLITRHRRSVADS